jgi:hypothetical protein
MEFAIYDHNLELKIQRLSAESPEEALGQAKQRGIIAPIVKRVDQKFVPAELEEEYA